jgi:putative phosphoribosyl transferase
MRIGGLMIFKDRGDAGYQLACQLEAYRCDSNVVVLALARGGVPVGLSIAQHLQCVLDVILVRKIGFPSYPEYAMGALGHCGVVELNQLLIQQHRIPLSKVKGVIASERKELERRTQLYRHGDIHYNLANKKVILVDDGIATGSSMRVAINVCRTAKAADITLAVPVAPPSVLSPLSLLVEETVCLLSPDNFQAVGQFYSQFEQVSDEQVLACLQTKN